VCTLVALFQVHRDHPLVIAANRDEFYARRTSGPQLLRDQPRVIGGRDEEKGGTWLGASEHGFFVGLTNQRSLAPPNPALASRGEVVLEALAQPGLPAAVRFLGALDGRAYNAFNLLVGDAERLVVAYARPEAAGLELEELPAGIWALPNDRLGSRDFPKIDRATELARPLAALSWDALVPRAQALLGDHELPPSLPEGALARLQALCVHTPAYGTRSASLLAFSARGLERYHHAEGPPCQAPLAPRADLARLLTRSDGSGAPPY